MKALNLNEQFSIYDPETLSWIRKDCLHFQYQYLDKSSDPDYKSSFRSTHHQNIILKLEFSDRKNDSDPFDSKKDFYPISLNNLYEIHHHDKKSFVSYLKDYYEIQLTAEQTRNTPNHIISITLDKDDYENQIFYYFNEEDDVHTKIQNIRHFIGCDLKREGSKKQWETFKAELYKNFRYSEQGIYDQMQIRFCKLIIKSFKDILRFLLKIHESRDEPHFYTSFQIYDFFKNNGLRRSHFEKNIDLAKEFQNIVYKCLISEGLFPFYIDLNTMDETWYSRLGQYIYGWKPNCLMLNEAILPWGPKFHASITIIDRYYSYTPANQVHQLFEKDRILSEKRQYYRIKILDFFPLDSWVEKISKFLYLNFDSFLDDISGCTFSKMQESEFHKDVRNIELESKKQKNKSNKGEISMPLLGGSSLSESEISDNVWLEYDKFKSKKKEEKREVYKILVRCLNTLCESVLGDNHKETLTQYLANCFWMNYKYEIKLKINILDRFCELLAKTEFSKYSTWKQNCQTIVAKLVLNVYDQLKNYIDVLLPWEGVYDRNNKFLRENYLKFSSEITNQRFFEKYHDVKPGSFNMRLNYYGIYVDELLKMKFDDLISASQEKIKEEKNSTIRTLQKEFEAKFFSLFNTEEIDMKIHTSEIKYREEEKSSIPVKINQNNQKDANFQKEKEEHKKYSLSNYLSSLLFNVQNELLENRKKIVEYNLNKITKNTSESKKKELNHNKYRLIDMFREFSYYYYNSIRLQNAANERKNYFSYIGFVIIKDPSRLREEKPENFETNDDMLSSSSEIFESIKNKELI